MGIKFILIYRIILIEPEFEDSPVKNIRIEIKAPLKNVDTRIDDREPRRLLIGISEHTDTGEESFNSFTLHFENVIN